MSREPDIPLCPPAHLKDRNGRVAGILNMNPNYLEENRMILSEMRLDIPTLQL